MMAGSIIGGIFGTGASGFLIIGLKGLSRLYERFTNLETQVAVIQSDVSMIKNLLVSWVRDNASSPRP